VKETLTTIEKALFFKEQDIFRNVGVEQIAEVAALAEEMHYEAGTVIVEQEAPSEHVYIVVEGHVVAEREGIVTTVVTPGKGFADLTLVPGSTYGFTGRAATHVHVLRIALVDFVEVMLEHPEIAIGIVRALAIRLKEANEQLVALGRRVQDGEPGASSVSDSTTQRQ
jgi:CRP-like cAMP-binding protein